MKSLTIVTGVLDGDPNLAISAESILPELKSGKAKWLIKNSTAAISDLLREYSNMDGVKIISEPDASLYEGLNQALKHVDDGFFLIVGAGDTLVAGAVDFILSTVESNSNLDGFYFAVELARSGRVLMPRPSELMHRMACPHPGAVLSVSKVRELGGFDERYQIAADYDLLCRYVIAFGASGWSDRVVVSYMGGGMSDFRAIEGFLEEELIRMRVCKSAQMDACVRGIHFFENAASQLRGLGHG
jgi:hypothetical protein